MDGNVVVREKPPSRLSRSALNLLSRCLEKDPNTRADISEIRGHRWLQGALERRGRED